MSSVLLSEILREYLFQQIRLAQSQVSHQYVSPVSSLRELPDNRILELAINWGVEDEVLQPDSSREVLLRQIQHAQRQESRLCVSDIGILRLLSDDRILELAISWCINFTALYLAFSLLNVQNASILPDSSSESSSDSSSDSDDSPSQR